MLRAGSNLRPARADDYRDIAALWTDAVCDAARGGRGRPYTSDDVESSAGSGELFVIEEVVDLVAVVALLRGGQGPGAVSVAGEAEISRLAVAAEFKRRGHARRLLAHCHSLARGRGISRIVLWSRPRQGAAHSLYRSLGYQRLPDRDRSNKSGEQIIFGLRLD